MSSRSSGPSLQGSRPSPRPRRRRGPAVWVALLAVLILAGCETISNTPPPATPTDFPGLTGRLAPEGIRTEGVVSGDPGCDDPELAPTAISFRMSGLDQVEPIPVYLYIFRNRGAFERNRERIGPCAASYVTDPMTFEQIEESPYVLAGQGPWAPEFRSTLREVLRAAAGTGG
jgi:hypothetical protein